MAIIQDWKIRTRSRCCAGTGRDFVDGEEIFTALFVDPESDGYLRKDYSAEAWEARDGDENAPFSFWQSRFELPPEEEDKKPTLEKESAEAMLRRMIDEDSPTTENARYILALMLERKKQLIPVSSTEADSRRMLFYEHKGSGEVFIVADPLLKLSEIEQVQAEVSALLGGESPTPPEGSASPESPGGEAATETPEPADSEEPAATATQGAEEEPPPSSPA